MRMGPPHTPRDPRAVEGAQLSRATVRRIWSFARPYRRMIALFLVAILAAALLALVPPLVVRAILDTAIPEADRALITLLAVLAVLAALGDAALAVLQRWCSARVGEGLIYDLRRALFAKVQRMPIAFFTRSPTGALISRLNNDVIGAQTAVTSTLGSVVSNVVVLVTTLAAMLALEWRLTLLALVVLPMFVIPARRVGRTLQDISRQQMQHNATMNTQMTERFNVAGAMLVKLFGDHHREDAAFERHAAGVRDTGIRSAMYGRVFFVALGVVGAVGAAAIYGVGAHLVVSGQLTSGTLVALAALTARVYQPLTGLTNARVDLMTSLVSFERVFEVLDANEPIQERPGAIDLVAPAGRVTFDDVRFRYPPAAETTIASLEQHAPATDPDQDVLSGLTIDIMPGETVALVGVSGAGKSTLVSLVPRLYDVTSGAVRIDGHDVRDLTLESLRAAIGVVAQDPHLFHDSIGDNLRYAKPDATTDELVVACRAARILDTVTALPDGFDTVVGDRGYRLSGGEKQRLAIARHVVEGPGGDDPRRGHQPPRQRQREPGPGGAGDGAVRPHGAGHRPPAVDDPPRRPHRRARRGTHRRARHARRAARPRRPLRRPAPRRHRRIHHHRPGLVTAPPLPLADLRVLDLSTVIAGPNCARYLADFGADVIKVERPGGDSLRNMAWRDERDGEGLWWKLTNRNKRNVVADLKDPAGLELVLRLADDAHVLVENFRPGRLERLGLGPDVLHARNPRLVVTRVSGFGQDGPYAERPGFATIAEAMSGLSAISGEPDGPPLLPPIALTDEATGLAAAFATMVALHSGRGQVVDISLLETMFHLMGPLPSVYALSGEQQPRLGAGLPYTVPRGTYRCADGRWIAVSTSSDSVAARVMELLGVGDDERFPTFAGRAAHRDELEALMSRLVQPAPDGRGPGGTRRRRGGGRAGDGHGGHRQ